MLQVEHLNSLRTRGVYKATVKQPVVVDNHAGALVLRQDLRVGYAGNDGIYYDLLVYGSAVLRLDEPDAVCAMMN